MDHEIARILRYSRAYRDALENGLSDRAEEIWKHLDRRIRAFGNMSTEKEGSK